MLDMLDKIIYQGVVSIKSMLVWWLLLVRWVYCLCGGCGCSGRYRYTKYGDYGRYGKKG